MKRAIVFGGLSMVAMIVAVMSFVMPAPFVGIVAAYSANEQLITPAPHDAPAGNHFLGVYYSDNYRRGADTGVSDNNLRLYQTGHIQNNWGNANANQHYGHSSFGETEMYRQFAGIVGTRGTFMFEHRNGNLPSPIAGSLFTVQFAPPAGATGPGDSYYWPALANTHIITSLGVTGEDNILRNIITINFHYIGTYRLTVRTRTGTTEHTNIFYMRIRNSIIGNESGGEMNAQVILSRANVSNDVPMNWLRVTNRAFNNAFYAEVRMVGRGRADAVFLNSEYITVNHQDDGMISGGDISDELFTIIRAPGPNNTTRQDRFRLTLREGVVFENYAHRLSFPIQINHLQIDTMGRAINVDVSDNRVIRNAVLEVVPWSPPSGPNTGLMFAISALVLALLGGGIFGVNYMIRKSEQTHITRREYAREMRDGLDRRNIELLRGEIMEEHHHEVMVEELLEYTDQIAKELAEKCKNANKIK